MFVDTKVRPQGEQVDAIAPSRMKLSAAIRVGARLRPQCRDVYGKMSEGTSCAVGAAWEAVTGRPPWEADPEEFEKVFGEQPTGIRSEIFKRNDAGYSRESIADWLEAQGL